MLRRHKNETDGEAPIDNQVFRGANGWEVAGANAEGPHELGHEVLARRMSRHLLLDQGQLTTEGKI